MNGKTGASAPGLFLAAKDGGHAGNAGAISG
jgi:hypothetical protein